MYFYICQGTGYMSKVHRREKDANNPEENTIKYCSSFTNQITSVSVTILILVQI